LDISEAVNYISIYYGVPGSGQQATLLTQIGAQNTASYNHPIQNGETYYYYARIVQMDGDEIFTSPIWYTRNDGQTEVVPVALYTTDATPVCFGVPLQLTYDGTGTNNQYFWSFSNGVVPSYSTEANPIVSFEQTGTYHVTVYVENAAGTSFYTQEITVEGCAGVLDHGLGYKIYPNPATTQLTIEVDADVAIDEIALVDAMGRMVLHQALENQGKNTVDISTFPSGMYVIQLLGSTQRITESLWIQK
jgi:PKD repeat protein